MGQLLTAKFFIPASRQVLVPRARLLARLNEGLHGKLTLLSAPAGSGKTTLVSEWLAAIHEMPGRSAAWLSLDDADRDPARFLSYIIAALQTVAPAIGEEIAAALQSPKLPPIETHLMALLNEISTLPGKLVLVLDDYHLVDARPVDDALRFMLEHLPAQLHLVITTREDPNLPLARLRARHQLNELRAADLRFTNAEAAEFLNEGMGLHLSEGDVAALEARTEGWIAGLQLAALSLQGHQDATGFIQSFTGNHHFIIDYLLAEVLQQQSPGVQTFLLRTSILDRLCGPLCDALLLDPMTPGQETLEYLERANLFIVPLDNERRWYRYHHLFAELLRQRLHQSTEGPTGEATGIPAELQRRASQWYEDNGFEIDAFRHAAAAGDLERAERLIEGNGVPLHFRGAGDPVVHWLETLPVSVLNARPSLWITYASALMMTGRPTAVEEKLQAAEEAISASLQGALPDHRTRDLIGRIASMRATLAVMQHDVETIINQSRRALEYLGPDNLPLRTAAHWSLGYAYQLQGDREAAGQAYAEVISISKTFGPSIYTTAATVNLGQVQEADNQLSLASETYSQAILLAGTPPRPIACEAHLGLARIHYQWNDLDAAEEHGQQCILLTRQMDSVETFAGAGVFLSRLKLTRGDVSGAGTVLEEAEAFVLRHNFLFRLPDVAAAQVLTLLHQGNLAGAAQLAEARDLPLSLARVRLAQGDPVAALELLEPLHQQATDRDWQNERLKVMTLQALAFYAQGEKNKALRWLDDALTLAEPGGFIRLFVDEGEPMRFLMLDFRSWMKGQAEGKDYQVSSYVDKLITAFAQPASMQPSKNSNPNSAMVEPLSERELEVLKLLRTELNGPEIARGLMVSLNTMRTHTRNIYSKLGVNNRRAAARRAEELHLV
jgi:LuxR family maltose regulon positive regulatory protein